jgi:hypothetical protein
MRRAEKAYGLGAALVALGTLFVTSSCQLETGPEAGAGGATATPYGGSGGSSGSGALRLPATFELRARWGDGGVQETLAQEGASQRRVYTRQGVGQSISFAPDDAARAMGTGTIELGLYSLPAYSVTRPVPFGCQPRIDVSVTGGNLSYLLSADELSTESSCQAFMFATANGLEVVYDGVPVALYSSAVEAPAVVQIKVIFSP